MSRIGKKQINIPDGVKVEINGGEVKVNGPKGSLSENLKDIIEYDLQEKTLSLKPKEGCDTAYWGLARSLIDNMVRGVSEGFEKKLEIIGVGYRAKVEGKKLVLNVGFSHPVNMSIPDGLAVEIADNTNLTVKGIDKQLIGQFSANVREVRPPEPYKGKGIRYVGEYVRRKVGKTGV
jgi:large subunit ribosomal protein L6